MVGSTHKRLDDGARAFLHPARTQPAHGALGPIYKGLREGLGQRDTLQFVTSSESARGVRAQVAREDRCLDREGGKQVNEAGHPRTSPRFTRRIEERRESERGSRPGGASVRESSLQIQDHARATEEHGLTCSVSRSGYHRQLEASRGCLRNRAPSPWGAETVCASDTKSMAYAFPRSDWPRGAIWTRARSAGEAIACRGGSSSASP